MLYSLMVEVRVRGTRAHVARVIALAALAGACGASSRANDAHSGAGGSSGKGGSAAAAGTSAKSGAGGSSATDAGGSSGSKSSGGSGGSMSGTGGSSAGSPSSGGSSGTPGDAGTTGDAGEPAVNPAAEAVEGSWAMFDFEDPVTASLRAEGSSLHGRGACGPMDSSLGQCGGDITGTLDGRRARFSFPVSFEAFGDLGTNYGADVVISEDGTRMAGSFYASTDLATLFVGTGLLTAWVRPAMDGRWLAFEDTALRNLLVEREGNYELELTEGAGDAYAASEAYDLVLRVTGPIPLLRGDLGAFWGGEMAWDDAAQTLSIGPVPETKPELPVAVSLVFEDTTLVTVQATLASGEKYAFDARPAL